jgi:ribonuclease BN (tRNA processing enzyme)
MKCLGCLINYAPAAPRRTPILPLLLALVAGPVAAQAPESTAVVLLGTGMPYPDPAAQGPAIAVTVGPRLFLFDAGPGVVRQMGAAGLPVRGGPVTAAFLTHLHSDHTLGLPDLILTSWVMGRHAPLHLFGPPGTSAMVSNILAAWAVDIDVRTKGLEQEDPAGYRVAVTEIEGGVAYDSAGVRITAIPVAHGSLAHAFGFRVVTPDRTIVISGDTRPTEAIVQAAIGADLLIHEVYASSRLRPEDRPGGEAWPAYMRSFHTSDRELGALAARARPGLLVLIHVIRMGASDTDIIAAVRAGGFTGPVVIGHDLDRF